MVYERAELPVVPGKEDEFEAALTQALPLLSGDGGAHSVWWGRGVENPSKFILLVQWDSPEHHVAFTKTDAFAEFAGLVRSFYSGKPYVEHFAPLG